MPIAARIPSRQTTSKQLKQAHPSLCLEPKAFVSEIPPRQGCPVPVLGPPTISSSEHGTLNVVGISLVVFQRCGTCLSPIVIVDIAVFHHCIPEAYLPWHSLFQFRGRCHHHGPLRTETREGKDCICHKLPFHQAWGVSSSMAKLDSVNSRVLRYYLLVS